MKAPATTEVGRIYLLPPAGVFAPAPASAPPARVIQLGVALKEFARGIHNRPSLVMMRVPGAECGWGVGAAVRVAGRTRLPTLDALLIDAAVMDNRRQVPLTSLLGMKSM